MGAFAQYIIKMNCKSYPQDQMLEDYLNILIKNAETANEIIRAMVNTPDFEKPSNPYFRVPLKKLFRRSFRAHIYRKYLPIRLSKTALDRTKL